MAARTKDRPRTKPPEERRDELMRAAERLFLKQGVWPTTIEQITVGAGVAKGTFYLYFSSKEDVLAALEERFGQQLLEKIQAAVARQQTGDWKEKLAAWVAACVTGYLEEIRLHDIVFYGTRPATREGLVDNIVIENLEELLQAGARAGAWPGRGSRSAAVFLFSGLHAVVDDAYAKEKVVNRRRLVRRAQQLFFGAAGLAVN